MKFYPEKKSDQTDLPPSKEWCADLTMTVEFAKMDGKTSCCGKIMDFVPFCKRKKIVINDITCIRCKKNDANTTIPKSNDNPV